MPPVKLSPSITFPLILLILILVSHAGKAHGQPASASGCEAATSGECYDKAKSQNLKVIGIFTILVASMIGVGLPLFTTALNPAHNSFVMVKALASGVILSTGFMHVLPDSWASLNSECLPAKPWREFAFPTFIAMVSAVFTMMMDTVATAYFKKRGGGKHVHCHGGHGGGGGGGHVEFEGEIEMGGGQIQGEKVEDGQKDIELLRYRIVAQVLEIGIVVHSVVIGLSMGVSNNPCTIRPLVAAMCFHQLFEGMGLGGCILQAEYKLKMKATMVAFFSTTTPFGIALGMGLLNVYNENSPTALIVVGVLNAISSGLLIYMALVDLLAADFMSPKLQSNIRLQLWGYLAVCFGMGCMSLMAKWA
ncbi:hypothetical protein V2J09_019164 [Rumex salicifolius]